MGQSLAQIYVHVIFSTKERVACLDPDTCRELHPYMAEVLNNRHCPALRVGGFNDHIHFLCCLSKNLSLADLIEAVKVPTSKWLKRQKSSLRDFHWQSGYGAFSVSASHVDRVCQYILDQDSHHRRTGFQDELRKFFRRYKVDYDERYVWD